MSRELWLLRHAKSDRTLPVNDFDRPLNKRGIKAAQRVGTWMKQQYLIPDVVISSPAVGAFSTAQLVCSAIAIPENQIRQDVRIYGEGSTSLMNVLADVPKSVKKVLLVGHNPELENLLIFLVGDKAPKIEKLLPTATFVRIVLPGLWTNLEYGCATLLSIAHPKSLSEGGI